LAIGNEIFNNSFGMYVSASEGDNSIENNLFHDNSVGIILDNTNNNNVVGNTFLNNTREGFKDAIYIRNAAQNYIEGNTFILNGVGVFMDKGANNIVQKNNFTSNSFGVYMTFNESSTYIGWSFNNQIVENSFLNNTNGISSDIGAAMFINSQLNTTIQGNRIVSCVNGVSSSLSSAVISANDIVRCDIGVALSLSGGTTITRNNVTSCNIGVAIDLSGGSLVYENVIADNSIGVRTSLSGACTIYHNDFMRNAQQAATSLSSSSWNMSYPVGGNYWTDYAGIDGHSGLYQNETGTDGIGDTPYEIDEENVDHYPLVKPFIVESYTLTIMSKAGGTTNPVPGTYSYIAGENITVAAIPDDGYSFWNWMVDNETRQENPLDITMNSNHSLTVLFVDVTSPEILIICPQNKAYNNETIPLVLTINEEPSWIGFSLDEAENETISGNATLVHSEGEHHILVYANDTSGNMGSSDAVHFAVDSVPPSIHIISPENKTYGTDLALTFIANETLSWSGYGLNEQVNITIAGNTTLTGLAEGSHEIVVYGTDLAGNVGTSNRVFFTVDATPPDITIVYQMPVANVTSEDDVMISAMIVDNYLVNMSVTLNYTTGNGTWIVVDMDFEGKDMWNATIPMYPFGTQITYIVIADDGLGNRITTEDLGYVYEYQVVPEFPTFLVLPIFMIATLLVMIVYKRKHLTRAL
jgi:parallel beta-helix repeat protein